MGRLTKEREAEASRSLAFQEREVEMPELGGSLLVRQLSAQQRNSLLSGLVDASGKLNDLNAFQVRMFAAGVADPSYSVDEAEERSRQWPGPMWDRVQDALAEMSGKPEEVQRDAAQEFPAGPDE